MDLKERVLQWLAADEERIEEPEALLTAFSGEEAAVVLTIRREMVLSLVTENLKAYPNAKFHDLKGMYPYPNSEELKAAQALLSHVHEMKTRH
ncbi:MAG: hypothetical protein A2527_09955 [Candidatus Lambdaproteobacteria bacterium RIFOXYD2_FULL_50_16]|uniref:Uncharacterized protein n=1 Tax=Candidatus Lambdaproteobacteria bacterium RIFOXYD2_FULL_50_16 TaxID=1817772 RepID=A0A1F6G732_9PROT|nr:MAG: hypothetical protein A2527_09955 [Candidatus Lambdaproteobacteria bacterium RIFOXYD2_FULL_50_16]